jgi:hypothetical protein
MRQADQSLMPLMTGLDQLFIALFSPKSDQFHFVYRHMSGDVDIIARLVSTEYRNASMKGGVMIRATLDPRSPHAFMFLAADGQLEFRSRLVARGATTQTPGNPGALPAWLKIERRGTVLSGYASTDGENWTFVGNEAIDLPAGFFVGLAVTSGEARRLAVATFDRVIAEGQAPEDPPPPPPNAKPTLTQPGNHTGQVGQGTQLQLLGSDPDGDTLTYGAAGLPPGLQLNASTGLISGTPTAAGTYTVTASVNDGALSDQQVFTWTIQAPPPPPPPPARYAVFEPSPDHATIVDSYIFEVAAAGAVGMTLVQQNVGKPAVVNGECRVEITALLAILPPGQYVARLKAVSGGNSSPFIVSDPFQW